MAKIVCPKCSGKFKIRLFEDLVSGYECQNCHGCLINIQDLNILDEEDALNVNVGSVELVQEDNVKALICPLSGTIMARFKFSNNSDRYLEYSLLSGYIWFDQGEFNEVLKEVKIKDIPKIFSDAFQAELREKMLHNVVEQRFRDILGNRFEEVKQLKDTIHSREELIDIMNYLKA